MSAEEMVVLCDGRVPLDGHEHGGRGVVGLIEGRSSGETSVVGLPTGSVGDLFRTLWRVRQERIPVRAHASQEARAA